jgi:L-arabonate dehydrase
MPAGLPALTRELGDLVDGSAATVTGRTLADNVEAAVNWNPEVIRPRAKPVVENAGIAVLRGNLAPNGALIKPAAATPALLKHRGRAVVFEGLQDFRARIDDPRLDVDADSILVMRNVGLRGFPGMPEVGNMPLPRKLLEKGVRDMVRISDARMSGTAYGTVILHVAPEASLGGPLALVRDGDFIEIDMASGRLHLDVADEELDRRRKDWVPPPRKAVRGYEGLFLDHVMQPDTGADFDFLVGQSGAEARENAH